MLETTATFVMSRPSLSARAVDITQRPNRPTPSSLADRNAIGAPARLSSTPMLVSERNCPGGRSPAEKNSPTLKPIAAGTPSPTAPASRPMGQVQSRGDCAPGGDQDAERLADEDRDRHAQSARFQRAETAHRH